MKNKLVKAMTVMSMFSAVQAKAEQISKPSSLPTSRSTYSYGTSSYGSTSRTGYSSGYRTNYGNYYVGNNYYNPIYRPITGTTPTNNYTSTRYVTKTENGVTTTTIYTTINGKTTVRTIVTGTPTRPTQPIVTQPKPTEPTRPIVTEPKPTEPTQPIVTQPKPTEPTQPIVVQPKPTEPTQPIVVQPKPTEPTQPIVVQPKPQPPVVENPIVVPPVETQPINDGPIIIKPTNPIATPNKPVAPNIPVGGIRWNDRTRGYDSNDPNNKRNVEKGIDGSGVIVGVLDSGFNNPSMQRDLQNKFGNRFTNVRSNNYAPSDATHGIEVSEMIAGNTANGIAPNARIVGTDVTITRNGRSGIKATADHYNSLYNQGARIFNQSFGIDSQVTEFHNDPNRRYSSNYYGHQMDQDVLRFWKDKINKENDGSLFIWAAGNERGDADSSLQGGLPYFEKDLEKGWINVVGLAARNGGQLRDFSWQNREPYSRAGVSKNWTVSAMADYVFDINGRRIISSGSSFAAPAVTGTAALVKQKYPWMDGNLIKQTILSTATDIGEAGVDDVYGWGLLDVEKATKGPAAFDSRLTADGGDAKMNVTAGTYSFDNDITGDVGLVKNGAGTVVLKGASTFKGNTILNEGAVVINGKSYTSKVNVGRNGTLATNNTRLENGISNGGTIVNNGNTFVNGGYVASADSRLISTLGSEMKVSGEVDLNNSTLELSAEKNGETQYVTKKGIQTNAITSGTGIKGNFSNVETSGLLNGKVEKVGENEIKATLSRKNVEEYVAETSDHKDEIWSNVASNLEKSFTALDEKIDENGGVVKATNEPLSKQAAVLQNTLATSTKAAALDSLSGQIYGSAQALTFQNSETVNKDLTNRLTMLGTLDNQNGGVWFSGIHGTGKLAQDGFGEAKTKTYAAQVGVDKKIGDNVIVGAAINYSKAQADFNRHGGTSKADGIGTSLYGRVGNKNNPWYAQGRIGYGIVDSDVEREIILSDTDRSVAKINHKDKVLSGYLETGYDFKKNDFTLTPFVGVSHDSVTRGAFSEENSQFGLTADKKTFSQTSGLVGVRASQGIKWKNGVKTTLQGYVTHQRAFNDEDLSFKASYSGLPGTDFTVKGIGLEKSQTWAGIGALTEFNPRMAWYVNYDAKINSKKTNNNVITTGLRWNF